jgi:probable rRNA maturation factor
MLKIEIANEQDSLSVDADRLRRAIEAVLGDAGIEASELSVAVVDDPTIHDLNRRFLAHDYPTDVLSFLLERDKARLEGEVVVSADTATREAARLGWPAGDELLLYVVHGTLHLVGYDDTTDELQTIMRAAEKKYLTALGLRLPEGSAAPAAPVANETLHP